MPTEQRWQQLGKLLMRRRIELDPRYSNRRTFEAECWPEHYRIINSLELGQRDNYEPATLAAIEHAYDLEPGAIGRFLDGGEFNLAATQRPITRTPSAPAAPGGPLVMPAVLPALDPDNPPFNVTESMREEAAPYLKAIEIRLRMLKATIPVGEPLPGARVFPDDPQDSEMWDRFAAFPAADLERTAWFLAGFKVNTADAGELNNVRQLRGG